jgi:hypothetical protein
MEESEIPKYVQDIFDAKVEWRKKQAKLPIEEKIKILVRIQKRAAPIKEAKGQKARIWKIEEND